MHTGSASSMIRKSPVPVQLAHVQSLSGFALRRLDLEPMSRLRAGGVGAVAGQAAAG